MRYEQREVSRMTPRFLALAIVWLLMSFTGMGKTDLSCWGVGLWYAWGAGGEIMSSFLDKLREAPMNYLCGNLDEAIGCFG